MRRPCTSVAPATRPSVRIRQKFGVRVLMEDEEAAWTFLRPGIEYVNSVVTNIFELHPVPHEH